MEDFGVVVRGAYEALQMQFMLFGVPVSLYQIFWYFVIAGMIIHLLFNMFD